MDLKTPKFIVGTDEKDEREFIVRLVEPRFVAEVIDGDQGRTAVTPILWIDPKPDNSADLIYEAAVAYLEFARKVTAH